jgi:hypothetical protein
MGYDVESNVEVIVELWLLHSEAMGCIASASPPIAVIDPTKDTLKALITVVAVLVMMGDRKTIVLSS